jgi:hypothetical protein
VARYTTQIRTVVEMGYPIFDFDYPIFDEAYRSVLETKIIDTYYFREIGFETIGQFKWFLKARMNNIMPFYNKHYLANENFETYDPYKNKNVTTTDSRTTHGDSSGNTTASGTNTGKDVFQDTPTSKLGNTDYATNITDTTGTSDGETNNTGEFTTTEEYTSTLAGHDGMKYPSDILQDLRKTFNNVDMMIISELSDLFMNIW